MDSRGERTARSRRDVLMWRQMSSYVGRGRGGIPVTHLLNLFPKESYDKRIHQEKKRPMRVHSCFLTAEGVSLSQLLQQPPTQLHAQHQEAWELYTWWYIRLSKNNHMQIQIRKKHTKITCFADSPHLQLLFLFLFFYRHWRHSGAVSPAIQGSVIWL